MSALAPGGRGQLQITAAERDGLRFSPYITLYNHYLGNISTAVKTKISQMPVPVSPDKQESSRDGGGATAGEEKPTPPQSNLPSERQREDEESTADPDVVAGYQDCLKETLRFLVEEERLPGDHPVVRGLVTHLTRQHAHAELTKLSQEVTAAPCPVTPLNAGFQVTLMPDDEDEEAYDEDMEDDELMEEEDMEDDSDVERESDEAFRRQLLRLVYQGCDLFAAPPLPPRSGLVLQL
ncbi:hypothetical protein GWK47_049399 [Chionoecetes opilio]|uniref:Orange domain-containing protein n=1 Tax=Chionoecetes opilio TaxID=41210 RepID=A0A8J4YBT6_CHIOP|nr:hypothetical protein GWK47_049399 [Chionoecetes opilio]